MSKPTYKTKHYEVKAEGTTAELRLIGEIAWWKNSSEEFTLMIDELLNAGVVNLDAYCNSNGGDMFEAPEIYNQVKRFTGLKVLTIGAMCASAATVFACAFDKVKMYKTGQYMIHNPAITIYGGKAEFETALKLYENVRELSLDIYVAKTGLSRESIAAMMDATTYMRADKAKELGFVNEVVDNISDPELAKIEMKADQTAIEEALKRDGIYHVKMLTPKQPTIQPIPEPTMNKPKLIAALMKANVQIAQDATDDQVTAAFEELANKHVQVQSEMAALRIDTATAKAKIIVQNAIDQKKITEADREQWMKDATAAPEMVERALSKIPTVQQASAQLGESGDPEEKAKAKMTFSQRMDNDSAAMLKMKAENFTEYARLYKEEYGIDCPK